MGWGPHQAPDDADDDPEGEVACSQHRKRQRTAQQLTHGCLCLPHEKKITLGCIQTQRWPVAGRALLQSLVACWPCVTSWGACQTWHEHWAGRPHPCIRQMAEPQGKAVEFVEAAVHPPTLCCGKQQPDSALYGWHTAWWSCTQHAESQISALSAKAHGCSAHPC